MAAVIESNLTAYAMTNGRQEPLGKMVNELQLSLPVSVTDFEAVGKMFKLEILNGFEAGKGEIKFSGLNTPIKNMISNPTKVFELFLAVNVRTETAETMIGDPIRRVYQLLVNFTGDIPLIGSLAAQEQAEYDTEFKLRRCRTTDNDREILYVDPYEDTYRVNGQNILEFI